MTGLSMEASLSIDTTVHFRYDRLDSSLHRRLLIVCVNLIRTLDEIGRTSKFSILCMIFFKASSIQVSYK